MSGTDPWAAFNPEPPPAAEAADPWASYNPQAADAEAPGRLGWAPTAIARGIGDLVGSVRDLGDLRAGLVRRISPAAADINDARPQLRNLLPTGEQAATGIMDATGITPEEPQTMAGRLGADALRMGAGSLLGGSLPGLARNVLMGGAAGLGAGAAGEVSGQNPVARLAGSLAPSAAGLARGLVRGNPVRDAAHALEGVTPAEMDAARQIMANGERLGTRVTLPEAVQQATGGRIRGLTEAQDLAQNSIGGQRVMNPMLDQREAGARRAAGEFADTATPVSPNVTQAPARVQSAAEAEVQAAKTARSTAVAPDYQAAADRVASDPRVAGQVDAALTRTLTDLDTVAAGNPALTEVFTRFRERLGQGAGNWEALQDVRREIRDLSFARTANGTQALDRKTGVEAGEIIGRLTRNLHLYVPELRVADAHYIAQTRRVVEPIEQGIVGRVADTADATTQRGLLFPRSTMGGSVPSRPEDTAAAFGRVAGTQTGRQRVGIDDLQAARDLLGAEVRTRLDEALTLRATGPADRAGASVAARLAPNAGRADALDGAFRALPGGDDAADGFRRLMDVFGAQSFAPPRNSATASRGEALRRSGTLVARPLQIAEDILRNVNTESLATAITTPDGYQMLRSLAHIDDPGRRAAVISGFLASDRARRATVTQEGAAGAPAPGGAASP